MADDLEQETVDAAGLGGGADPFAPDIARLRGRKRELETRTRTLESTRDDSTENLAAKYEERGTAGAPLRAELGAKLRTRPSAATSEQEIPEFQRPKMDKSEFQQTFSMLQVAAMLFGAASRTPFYGTMQAMTGAMDGMMKGDDARVKEALTLYDKNVATIKANNDLKRRKTEAALKDYAGDINGLQQQLKLIATEFDDPILAETIRSKAIGQQVKEALEREKTVDTTLEHLLKSRGTFQAAMERSKAKPKPTAAGGRGVTPTSTDSRHALELIANDDRFDGMEPGSMKAFADAAAAIAKSLTISKEVSNFDEGMDKAVEQLIAQGRVKKGGDKKWGWVPFTGSPPSFGPAAGATAPTAAPVARTATPPAGNADLRAKAAAAIEAGKDPVAVKQRYKELTGEDYDAA